MSEDFARKRKQGLALYLGLFIIVVLSAVAYIILNWKELRDNAPSVMAMVFAMLFFASYMLSEAYKYYSLKIPQRRLVKILKCSSCGYVSIDKPRKGDYIFKTEKPCPKCGGQLIIIAIYSEKVK